MHNLSGVEPAPIAADEVQAYVEGAFAGFNVDVAPHHAERWQRVIEPDRVLVVRDQGRIVAGCAAFSRRLTIPGGETPVAAVTLVGVRPTHRRRGLLTSLMRRQLADVREREPVAALWASEPVIYGRFGYGMAARGAVLDVDKRTVRLRNAPGAPVDLLAPAEALDAMGSVYEQVRAELPGMLDRDGPWWEDRLGDHESDRGGKEPLRAAVTDGAYALYAVKQNWSERPVGEVEVREAIATTPESRTTIWSFLFGLDLMTKLRWRIAPSDHPLPHMVVNAHDVQVRLTDNLFVRLVDVAAALAARSYREPFEVVFELADEVCPWNAGRWALRWDGSTATCARTATPAGLELGASELGAAYLGGTTLDELARAGRVTELRAGALAAASRAFQGERAPWCPEVF